MLCLGRVLYVCLSQFFGNSESKGRLLEGQVYQNETGEFKTLREIATSDFGRLQTGR